jgi:hypothetical protein
MEWLDDSRLKREDADCFYFGILLVTRLGLAWWPWGRGSGCLGLLAAVTCATRPHLTDYGLRH